MIHHYLTRASALSLIAFTCAMLARLLWTTSSLGGTLFYGSAFLVISAAYALPLWLSGSAYEKRRSWFVALLDGVHLVVLSLVAWFGLSVMGAAIWQGNDVELIYTTLFVGVYFNLFVLAGYFVGDAVYRGLRAFILR